MKNINQFFSKTEQQAILEAIKAAEKDTSGEIRVHLENHCKGDALNRAIHWFGRLKMNKTTAHNGVILYLAVKDRKVAVWGDQGINKQVPENFWQDVLQDLLLSFRDEAYSQGVITAIRAIGLKLKELFPYQSDDKDELSNDISYGS
jgi:uncharacterized membrane protein